eukprot:Colp12_sorted_trinity150504_noHs@21281
MKPVQYVANHYDTWYQEMIKQDLEAVIPVDLFKDTHDAVGGVPSVLLSREVLASGRVQKQLKERLQDCTAKGKCNRQELYFDITGLLGSPQEQGVSISKGFRTAAVHYVVGSLWSLDEMESYYALGENSYFSESAYLMRNNTWQQRYWGENYPKLQQVKKAYDPEGLFSCHHCVDLE